MSAIELDDLLREISPEAPSGEQDLAHDPAFMELQTDIEGTPAVEVGKKIVQEAKDPDWSKIRKSALGLLDRAHDLRVAVSLTRALLHTDGFQGLSDGLSIIYGFVDRYWDSVYPQLDPEDDEPIERINALEELNDWNVLIAPLLKVSLCSSRAVGTFNLRHYRIASGRTGELTVSEVEKKAVPTLAIIEGAFADTDLEELRATTENAGASLQTLKQLEALMLEKAGPAAAPDLQRVEQLLVEINHLLEDQLSRRQPAETSKTQKTPRTEEEPAAPGQWHAAQPELSGEAGSFEMVESREEVLQLLDKICAYYEVFEPSSPVPLLLRRAMRLVAKNFLEILEDLAPSSLGQVEVISGTKGGSKP